MNKIGKIGEDIACMFLKKHGYRIIDRNYLKKWGELDIVAKKKGIIYFIEVKSMSYDSVTHGTVSGVTGEVGYRPEDNMNKTKKAKFVRIIQTYLQEKGLEDCDWSPVLMAIRIDLAKKIAKVRFIDNLILS